VLFRSVNSDRDSKEETLDFVSFYPVDSEILAVNKSENGKIFRNHLPGCYFLAMVYTLLVAVCPN
jgi:hypothetical protein